MLNMNRKRFIFIAWFSIGFRVCFFVMFFVSISVVSSVSVAIGPASPISADVE